MHPFILSIETDAGIYQHGYHLGTDERLARSMAVSFFKSGHPSQGLYIRTVALRRVGNLVDIYDGQWGSEISLEDLASEPSPSSEDLR